MQFRLDLVGLSTEEKPTQGLQDGTTYYTVDTQELYIFYKGIWYNQEPEAEAENSNSEKIAKLEIKKEETPLEEPVEEVKGE